MATFGKIEVVDKYRGRDFGQVQAKALDHAEESFTVQALEEENFQLQKRVVVSSEEPTKAFNLTLVEDKKLQPGAFTYLEGVIGRWAQVWLGVECTQKHISHLKWNQPAQFHLSSLDELSLANNEEKVVLLLWPELDR